MHILFQHQDRETASLACGYFFLIYIWFVNIKEIIECGDTILCTFGEVWEIKSLNLTLSTPVFVLMLSFIFEHVTVEYARDDYIRAAPHLQ